MPIFLPISSPVYLKDSLCQQYNCDDGCLPVRAGAIAFQESVLDWNNYYSCTAGRGSLSDTPEKKWEERSAWGEA